MSRLRVQAVIFRYVTPRIRAKVGMCDLNMPKARSGIPDQSDLRAFQDRKSSPSLRDPRELEV